MRTLLITLLLHALAVMPAPSPLIVSQLPDGVSISGSEALRQVVASWDIFVTLEPPPYPQQLFKELTDMDMDITFDALTQLNMGALDLSLQAHRLRRDHIRAALGPHTTPRRTKRGLLDIGGTVLHALFGVATNSQLERFNAALTAIAGTQQDMSHATSQLATIVNQTGSYLRSVAVKQHELQINVLHINAAISKLSNALENQSTRIHRLELLTALDRYLDLLDLATRQYSDQVALYNRQRAGLEMGHLTRDLLTPARLTEILAQASAVHQVVDNLEWYYSYLSVSPLWRKSDSLLYKVELPLIAPRPYLMYEVAALPVPLDNSTYAVNLNLKPNYALDTVSGNIFVPSHCLGHTPILCASEPEFGPSLLKCARGLITSRPSLIKSCKASVKDYSGQPPISTLALNQYAISTHGETLTVRCPGRPESHMHLARGTYNVTCLDPCTLQGQGYLITCVDRLFLSRRYSMPTVRVTSHFNFSTAVNVHRLRIALPQLQNVAAQPIMDLDAHALIFPVTPTSQPPIRSRPSILAIINLATLFFVMLALSIIYWRHRLCKHKDAHVTIATLEGEALPLTTMPHNTEQPSHAPEPVTHAPAQTSIWPHLPPISDCARLKTQCTY